MQIDFGEGGVAADGNGRNSPFTAALIRHMSARGLEIRQMIARVRRDVLAATGDRQVPWDNSSLVDDVYLAEVPSTVPSLPPTPAPVVPLRLRQNVGTHARTLPYQSRSGV